MKRLIAFTLLLTTSVATVLVLSQDVGTIGETINLDLPYNGGGAPTTEEDAAEIIFFYGQQLEADVFVFCVDRSGSMNRYGALATAKREIIRILQELSPETEFALCFFDTELLIWPLNGMPVEANATNRATASAWVARIGTGRQSCPQAALVRSLQTANRSEKSRRCVVYVGDGGGTCFKSGWERNCPREIADNPGREFEGWYLSETLDEVDKHNLKDVSVNTVGVKMGMRPNLHQYFVRELAQRNDGTCTLIE